MIKKKKQPRNLFEKRIHNQLKRKKIKFSYEAERIPYVLARHYVPDFIISTKLGKVYVECKGYLRPEDKSKLRAVKKQHPEIDLRILFYEERKSNIRWAERNGFVYAIGTIPSEWVSHG